MAFDNTFDDASDDTKDVVVDLESITVSIPNNITDDDEIHRIVLSELRDLQKHCEIKIDKIHY